MTVRRGTCKQCGAPFEQNPVGKPRKFCCDACQRQWWKENWDKRKRYTYTCQYCGKEYLAKMKDRDKFCSRECAFAFKAAVKKQREQDEVQGIGSFCTVHFVECSECGEVFTAQRQGQMVCCRECSLARSRRLWQEHKESIGRNAGRIETLVCEECGKSFEHEIYNQTPRFCSKRCSRTNWKKVNPDKARAMQADQQRRRRARKYGNGPAEPINCLAVYERDNWYCGICGGSVDASLSFPHPYSASLDHIVPLACGGTHTLSNVQLAHFICNSKKGSDGGGQLRLGLAIGCDQ